MSKRKTETIAPEAGLLDLAVQFATRISSLPEENELRRWTEAALVRGKGEMTIRIVDEDESATLNQTYRHKPGPTNVLSFPAHLPAVIDHNLLGDIVICAPVVIREAVKQHKPAIAHWAHMVVHGVLHLQGYDHQSDSEAEIMECLEIRILTGLGYPNPYQIKGVFNDS